MEGQTSTLKKEFPHVTGVQMNYYFICRTKLWLFSHLATMEHSSEAVALGKLAHEESYSRARKELKIGPISIDFVKKGDEIVLHEVKKSRKLERAHVYQMLYYLYYLNQKGVEARGVINYPLLRRTEEVVLSEAQEEEIEAILRDIDRIVNDKKPPEPEKKGYCRKCSYFEFCWVRE